jgi:hypothetical protein
VSINGNVNHYVHILMHTISFEFKPTMKVNIHNQCSEFKLTNQEYFDSDITDDELPEEDDDDDDYDDEDEEENEDEDEEDDEEEEDDYDDSDDDTRDMNIGYKPSLSAFGGALMYELEREDVESDDQSESIYTKLFIAWKSKGYKDLCVFLHLIESEDLFYFGKAILEEYYQRHANQLSIYTDPIKDTWLLRDGTVLMTKLELDFTQRDGALSVTISKGIKDDHTRKPVWVNMER